MKKRPPPWVFGMAIVLAPTLVFLALALGGARLMRQNKFKEVTSGDRAHLVTAADLGVQADAAREVLMKTEEDTGALRLTYRYPVELMPDDPVSIECLVVRTLDAEAAKHALDLIEFEVRRAFVRKEVLPWGDESRAGLLMKDGRPVGTVFMTRKERFVFVLRVTGRQHEPAELEAAVRPKLERLTRFGEER